MDAKDLRTESALGDHTNDGNTKYAQSSAVAQCNRGKPYQDMGSSSLGKVDVPSSRPCAVIGPDRVVPPASDAYLKKTPIESWPAIDNYRRPPDYPHKITEYHHPNRNISPRQTFQENMQRIMVPPTYNSAKLKEDHNFPVDPNVAALRINKINVTPETKYCDVPYNVNTVTNEQKNIRTVETSVPNMNPGLARGVPHGWHPSGGNIRAAKPYNVPEMYQYPEYSSCAGPRSVLVPRPHRTIHEKPGPVYPPESYYHEGNVRFEPYPSVKERLPQARYDYLGNYSNPFHPPPNFPSPKYDLQKSVPPHPYPGYPQVPFKYLDSRMAEPIMNGYQRPVNQQANFNPVQFRNQIMHPSYASIPNNCIQSNKFYPYSPDNTVKNKLPYDNNNKIYAEYENARVKPYPLPDSYYINEMTRPHPHMKGQVLPPPNYPTVNMQHPMPHPHFRKETAFMKGYEYSAHYRNIDPSSIPLNSSALSRFTSQFSPNAIAISPSDSNTSNDTAHTQSTSHDDCGYVSQSSTTSIRSIDSTINRIPTDMYGRYDYRYGPIKGPHIMSKAERALNNNVCTKGKKDIDVRQFLRMWNEGEDDNGENNKEVAIKVSHSSDNIKQHESNTNEQLYVLGLVNVPSDELGKYEHIQKVSKLPENIKGYNSIELLNQFEEVIGSSNLNNYNSKPPTPRDFHVTMKNSSSLHGISIPPRPISPLDVEAKISQSVIHKEVGCNFEIKPCSPKMLNVEIASSAQSVLGERLIEKMTNPHILSPPVLRNVDQPMENYNVIKHSDHRISTEENIKAPSCKMINTQWTEPAKTNYSLQDLESNSGICLASLPRLDNDCELNFPEVNQQFINANKVESVITSTPKDLPTLDVDSPGNCRNSSTPDINNISFNTDSEKEICKLSRYRKLKKRNESDDKIQDTNTTTMRTDSVIIKNPENTKNIEENIAKVSPLQKTGLDVSQSPMNLTLLKQDKKDKPLDNQAALNDMFISDIAIDFSSKSNEGPRKINDIAEETNSNMNESNPPTDENLCLKWQTVAEDNLLMDSKHVKTNFEDSHFFNNTSHISCENENDVTTLSHLTEEKAIRLFQSSPSNHSLIPSDENNRSTSEINQKNEEDTCNRFTDEDQLKSCLSDEIAYKNDHIDVDDFFRDKNLDKNEIVEKISSENETESKIQDSGLIFLNSKTDPSDNCNSLKKKIIPGTEFFEEDFSDISDITQFTSEKLPNIIEKYDNLGTLNLPHATSIKLPCPQIYKSSKFSQKELYSPRFQNLIFNNEGLCGMQSKDYELAENLNPKVTIKSESDLNSKTHFDSVDSCTETTKQNTPILVKTNQNAYDKNDSSANAEKCQDVKKMDIVTTYTNPNVEELSTKDFCNGVENSSELLLGQLQCEKQKHSGVNGIENTDMSVEIEHDITERESHHVQMIDQNQNDTGDNENGNTSLNKSNNARDSLDAPNKNEKEECNNIKMIDNEDHKDVVICTEHINVILQEKVMNIKDNSETDDSAMTAVGNVNVQTFSTKDTSIYTLERKTDIIISEDDNSMSPINIDKASSGSSGCDNVEDERELLKSSIVSPVVKDEIETSSSESENSEQESLGTTISTAIVKEKNECNASENEDEEQESIGNSISATIGKENNKISCSNHNKHQIKSLETAFCTSEDKKEINGSEHKDGNLQSDETKKSSVIFKHEDESSSPDENEGDQQIRFETTCFPQKDKCEIVISENEDKERESLETTKDTPKVNDINDNSNSESKDEQEITQNVFNDHISKENTNELSQININVDTTMSVELDSQTNPENNFAVSITEDNTYADTAVSDFTTQSPVESTPILTEINHVALGSVNLESQEAVDAPSTVITSISETLIIENKDAIVSHKLETTIEVDKLSKHRLDTHNGSENNACFNEICESESTLELSEDNACLSETIESETTLEVDNLSGSIDTHNSSENNACFSEIRESKTTLEVDNLSGSIDTHNSSENNACFSEIRESKTTLEVDNLSGSIDTNNSSENNACFSEIRESKTTLDVDHLSRSIDTHNSSEDNACFIEIRESETTLEVDNLSRNIDTHNNSENNAGLGEISEEKCDDTFNAVVITNYCNTNSKLLHSDTDTEAENIVPNDTDTSHQQEIIDDANTTEDKDSNIHNVSRINHTVLTLAETVDTDTEELKEPENVEFKDTKIEYDSKEVYILKENCESKESYFPVNENSYSCYRHNVTSRKIKSLKRSLSDSALDTCNFDVSNKQVEDSPLWPNKRKKCSEAADILSSDVMEENYCNINYQNRRNSISAVYNEENVSYCILIDNTVGIITEDEDEADKICFAEITEDCIPCIPTDILGDENIDENSEIITMEMQDESQCEYSNFVLQSNEDKSFDETWVDDVACVETVVSDDIAEDIVVSATSSPRDTDSSDDESNNNESGVSNTPDSLLDGLVIENCHTDKVKYIYGDKMCTNDAQIVETLYRTPQMNVNKTLIYQESQLTDNCGDYYDTESLKEVLSESPNYKHSTCTLGDERDTPINVAASIHDDEINYSNIGNSPQLANNCKNSPAKNDELIEDSYTKNWKTQDATVHSCESSVDNDFSRLEFTESYKNLKCTVVSSSPEVSSTTPEEKNSSILLKITNYGGSRVAQVNDIINTDSIKNTVSCKYTEKRDYTDCKNNLPPRPLITKAAQKYIPPLKETLHDLKVKLRLPQHSLFKLKQLKVSKELKPNLPKHRIVNINNRKDIPKKIKPKFEDVLKSIDEIQFKMHKEKSKKSKKCIPKVVIKKNENGSHYTSSNKHLYNPDLTGRKWQPWVFIEKNDFVDKMAISKKSKAIFNHRKKTFVLAETFKKYRSSSSLNNQSFTISQPKLNDSSAGQLKYTIRLKQTY